MKKLSTTKPISSPDKFPPPLMRFLRSNAGNRSRGRSSRSSPMFLRKKKNNNTATTIETKEPSSPKVTCMGQVRAKRSSKQTIAKKGQPSSSTTCRRRCWWWVSRALFCFPQKKPGSLCHCQCQPVRPSWGFFRIRRKRKPSKVAEKASTKNGSNVNESETEELERKNRVNCKANATAAFVVSNNSSSSSSSSPPPPPRNALLLMRCKSAPYSSSSLASRFWGEETEHPSEKPRPEVESVMEREGVKDPKLEELKMRFFKELEDSLRERVTESEEKVHELKRREEETEGDSVSAARPPMLLTRCKSERPRIAHGFD